MKDNAEIRKQLIERMLKTEQMLRNMVEHSNEIFYLPDIHHKFTYVSPQSLQIFGYFPDEMMLQWTKLVTDKPFNR